LSIGRELQQTAQRLGGPAILDIYDGEAHDFFRDRQSAAPAQLTRARPSFWRLICRVNPEI
jgi:hypothetical protein